MLVVGASEVENRSVAVRPHGGGEQTVEPLDALTQRLAAQVKSEMGRA